MGYVGYLYIVQVAAWREIGRGGGEGDGGDLGTGMVIVAVSTPPYFREV